MQKLGIVRKFVIIFGFLACLAAGFVAMNVMTSCDATAQCTCGNQCTYLGSPSIALGIIEASPTQTGIAFATLWLTGYFALAMTTGFMAAVDTKILEVTNNQVDWWDTFWYYNLRPAMMDWTDQMVTMDQDQNLQLGKFADAQNVNRTNRDIQFNEIQSHRELRPGENVCQAATISGGLTRAYTFRRAYGASAPAERAPRSGNAVGTAAAQGPAADQKERWDDYVSNYCDPTENAGASGCTTPGGQKNRDVDVTGEIFAKETIDLKDATTKKVVDDIITNIAEPTVRQPIPEQAITSNSSQAHEAVLSAESYRAKRQVIYDALYSIVARRAPGSAMKEFLEPMRQAAGVSNANISANPSHNEIMQVMMAERFRTGTYSVDQVDEPENNQREMVIQQAFQAMQMSDQIDLLDHYSLLVAADLSENVDISKQKDSEVNDRPLK